MQMCLQVAPQLISINCRAIKKLMIFELVYQPQDD
ncbi:MAG: hypothetical protein ACI9KN_001511 [Gammaproteobacteria bacterium]|jgi:hypothetical protein